MRGRIDGLVLALVSTALVTSQADFDAPPRYDGAGYATLAKSLLEERDYRSIDHPDAPRHAHFPPGYPVFLATLWSLTGESDRAAHVASILCSTAATLVVWRWYRTFYQPRTAFALALALAVGWAWSRSGSGIQSEPLYELLGWLAVLWTTSRCGRDGILRGLLVGAALGATVLTRQIGVSLIVAVFLELALRGWRRTLLAATVAAGVLITPWIAWSATVGRTQAGLLVQAGGTLGYATEFLNRVVFYVGRVPDQLTAPIVEIATVFTQSQAVLITASVWATALSAIVLLGWMLALKNPRRRLAGLVGFVTGAILLIWPYTEAGRFLIPLIPSLLVGGLEGLAWSMRRLRLNLGRTAAARLLLLAALPYSIYSVATADRRLAVDRDPAFEAACTWLRNEAPRFGPVLCRHPGEVFLATGRRALEVETAERPGARDADSDAISEVIDRYRVAYLLVDSNRYARAATSPLERFVEARPQATREVLAVGGVRVYEVNE